MSSQGSQTGPLWKPLGPWVSMSPPIDRDLQE